MNDFARTNPAGAKAGQDATPGTILAINSGSSSIKFALFSTVPNAKPFVRGEIENLGTNPSFHARDAHGTPLSFPVADGAMPGSQHDVLGQLLAWIESLPQVGRLAGIGHRIVHGGTVFTDPVLITPDVLGRLEALTPLAPLHQPASLAPVKTLLSHRPDVPQIACFDTAFHATMPPVAATVALPRTYGEKGVRRYGFHGLSYDHIAARLAVLSPHLAAGRTLVAHLGSGASLCALRAGRSVETTMGFSVLDGLMMGTRCGHIDPGILLYLMQAEGMDHDAIEHMLYHDSGLLGVSGLSADMRVLLDARDTSAAARQAIELFLYRIVREAGGLIACLGGLDGLVFTAGIGEHAPEIRAGVGAGLAWLGIEIDPVANEKGAPVISTPASKIEVRVEPADEEEVIRRCVLGVLDKTRQP